MQFILRKEELAKYAVTVLTTVCSLLKQLANKESQRYVSDLSIEQLWPLWIKEYTELKSWTDPAAYSRRMALGFRYVFPIVGQKRPKSVTVSDVVSVLELAMKTTEQTHWKVLICLSQFLRWCTSKHLLEQDHRLLTDIDLIEPIMGMRLRIPGGHHPAIDWRDVPRFVELLVQQQSISAKALLFTILTASRVQSVTFARWGEINVALKEWQIPASHMKGKQGRNRPHDVPLSKQSLTLLKSLSKGHATGNDLIFSATGQELSSTSLRKVIKKLDSSASKSEELGFRDSTQGNRIVVTHGFRATFATWAQENDADMSVVERCLAHVDPNDKHNGAYRRGTLIKQRRKILQRWADYCFSQVGENPFD